MFASVWEESIAEWDDADAVRRCGVPLAYLDAGTTNADLAHAAELCPRLMIGRTIGSGHFSPLEVPEQISAMTERFLSVTVGH